MNAEYQGSAFVNGAWQPWHTITRKVYENRQRWPRDGYRVREYIREAAERAMR